MVHLQPQLRSFERKALCLVVWEEFNDTKQRGDMPALKLYSEDDSLLLRMQQTESCNVWALYLPGHGAFQFQYQKAENMT